ncbi:hypothetical protein Tco_0550201 [Tanacetum coccineum]
MANLPPNHNEFAPAAEAAPDNMNGWVEEEDPEMEEEEEDPEMEEEEEEMDADEEWDGPEWILPYQGADPLYPPPPASDSESEIEFEESKAEVEAEAKAEVAPIPPPPVPANPEPEAVWTGSSSSSAVVGHDPEDPTLSHIRSDLNALHRRVRQIENDDVRAENKRLRMMLDCSENRTRDAWRELDQPPYALPEALLATVIHNDPRDLYIAARDAATAPATNNDDSPTHEETSPSEPQGSPPQLMPLVVNARRQGGNANEAGGQGGAPAVRECTFSGFMKCNPTVFHGHEGAVELSRWFEKTEMVFGISECAEARRVKFAAATLQGRALTWWNFEVATMGLEAANQIGWTEIRRLMTEEFCPIKEIQRMEHEL